MHFHFFCCRASKIDRLLPTNLEHKLFFLPKNVGGNSCFILASATFEDNSCGSWPPKNVFGPQFKTIRFPFQATTGAQVDDHPTLPNPAVKAFASLGSDTKYGGNLERDLHRWLRGLYGFRLQSYTLTLNLQVALRNSTIGFTSLLGFDFVQLDAQTVFFLVHTFTCRDRHRPGS